MIRGQSCPNRCDSEGRLYGGTCVQCGGKGWIHADSPDPNTAPVVGRVRYHALLDQAMDATPEGQSFLGRFVDLIVMEGRQ